MADKERAKTHFYAKPPTSSEEPVPSGPMATQPDALGDQRPDQLKSTMDSPVLKDTPATIGFKSAARTNTQVVTTRIPTYLLEQVRKFCEERRITFTSFVEVALAEELRKQLGNEGE